MNSPHSSAPVGVFDSGLGGLTVLRALRAQLPQEDFLYFSDARHLPYGDKPEAFLRERGQAVAQALVGKGCKALVIACNTATAAAAEVIRATVSVPVVALEPGVKPAVAQSKSGVIGVLATTRTLESPRFQRLVVQHAEGVRIVPQACPGLADAIEQHGAESAAVMTLLDRYVAPLAAAGADVVVLGCTHYPWVAAAIAERLPAGTVVQDTGEAVARQTARVLAAAGLQGGQGRLQLASSGVPAQVASTATRLWGAPLHVDYWEI